MEERIQKILARLGYGSRRSSEILIAEKHVKVNGKIAILGTKADLSKDKISVDSKILQDEKILPIYIALHKPKGVLSDIEEGNNRENVRNLVNIDGHLFPVGRLDLDSEGLILLTNDGELANKLTHPRYGHEKEYRVLVTRLPDDEQLAIWRRGVVMQDGKRSLPAKVRIEKRINNSTWLRVILREGKKRQIREIGKLLGLPVKRILRIRIGTLELGDLKPREWRFLNRKEIASLKGEQKNTINSFSASNKNIN